MFETELGSGMKRGTLDHKEMGLLKKTKEEEAWGERGNRENGEKS